MDSLCVRHSLLQVCDSCGDVLDVVGSHKLCVSCGHEYSPGHTAEEVLEESANHMDGYIGQVHPLLCEGASTGSGEWTLNKHGVRGVDTKQARGQGSGH